MPEQYVVLAVFHDYGTKGISKIGNLLRSKSQTKNDYEHLASRVNKTKTADLAHLHLLAHSIEKELSQRSSQSVNSCFDDNRAETIRQPDATQEETKSQLDRCDIEKLYNSLSDTQRRCLSFLHHNNALNQSMRCKAATITLRIDGPQADYNTYKLPLAALVRNGLLESKTGSGGGYWLSRKGSEMMKSIDINTGRVRA